MFLRGDDVAGNVCYMIHFFMVGSTGFRKACLFPVNYGNDTKLVVVSSTSLAYKPYHVHSSFMPMLYDAM